jgi:hypothetical protein
MFSLFDKSRGVKRKGDIITDFITVYSLKLKRLFRIMCKSGPQNTNFIPFSASKWEKYFMSEIFVAKRSKHICQRPPYMVCKFCLPVHTAGAKLILSS